MRKKCFIFLILLIFIIKDISFIKESILSSLVLWRNNIFPVFFPFLILTYFMKSYNIDMEISKIFDFIFYRLFGVNGSYVFFTSVLSGCPNNALMAKELNLSKAEITKLISFCSFSSPLFIIETVGHNFFGSKFIGYKLLIIMYLSCIIYGLISKGWIDTPYRKIDKGSSKVGLDNIIPLSISTSINTLLLILGSIIISNIFLVFIRLHTNRFLYAFISGFIEITSGIYNITNLNISLKLKEILSIIFISFNGLSIHIQLISVLNGKFDYFYFLKSKIYIIFISVILLFCFDYIWV